MSIYVSFMVNRVPMRQVFLPVFLSHRVNTIPPTLHTHPHVRVSLTRKTKGRSLGTSQKATVVRKSGSTGWKGACRFCRLWSVNNERKIKRSSYNVLVANRKCNKARCSKIQRGKQMYSRSEDEHPWLSHWSSIHTSCRMNRVGKLCSLWRRD